MTLEELKQIKQDVSNGIVISKSTWLKAIDTAIVFGEALEEYADVKNWDMNDDGMLQTWVEPHSYTPESYHGCELAQKALGIHK